MVSAHKFYQNRACLSATISKAAIKGLDFTEIYAIIYTTCKGYLSNIDTEVNHTFQDSYWLS